MLTDDDEPSVAFGLASLDAALDGRYDAIEIIEARRGALLFRAIHPATGRTVLVKLLVGQRVAPGSAAPTEVTALAALAGHANVVDLLDAGTTADGVPYLLTEWVGAGTLAELAARRSAPDGVAVGLGVGVGVATVVGLVADVATALTAAHELGIIHCDVKPSNILIGHDGRARLADFGIARLQGEDPPTLDDVRGTISYLAPEVLDGGHPSAASDVYSLAQTMWEVSEGAGRRTDPGEQSPTSSGYLNAVATSMQHPDGRRFESLRRRGAPVGAVAVLERGLSADPSDRPDAAQMTEALRSIAAGSVGRHTFVPTSTSSGTATVRTRRRWITASLAMVVAAAIIGFIAGSDSAVSGTERGDEPVSVAKFCVAARAGLDGQNRVIDELTREIDSQPSRFELVRHLVIDVPKQLAIAAAPMLDAARRLDSTRDSALLLAPCNLRSLMLADGIYAVTKFEFITDQQSSVDRLGIPVSLRPLVLAWDDLTTTARSKCGRKSEPNRKATVLSLIRSRLGDEGCRSSSTMTGRSTCSTRTSCCC